MTVTLNAKAGGWDSTGLTKCADGKYWTKCLVGNQTAAPKAFPEAEGVGTQTRGGANGVVIKVTTLNDSGAGSFREALLTAGPRIIIFSVSGIIDLLTEILVVSPNFTIAGQTSPGGILISGARITFNTNDGVIRHIRVRTGNHNNNTGDDQYSRGMQVNGNGNGYANPAFNIVFDHCSISWTGDQALTIQEDAYDVTVQYCYIGEALDNTNHAFGLFYWGKYTLPTRQFSAHHNVTTHNRNRNPEINFNGQLDHYNNVNYNSMFGGGISILGWSSSFSGPTNLAANLEHNYNKMGPASSANSDKAGMWLEDPLTADANNPLVYVNGNLGARRTLQSMNNNVFTSITRYVNGFSHVTPADADYLASVPFTFVPKEVTTMSDAYAQTVVDMAGATVPLRDEVDTRLALDFTNGTGVIRQSVNYPADYPDLVTNAPALPADVNNDGIPDAYEVFRGVGAGTLSVTGVAPSGYTWIEEYINQLGNGEYTV